MLLVAEEEGLGEGGELLTGEGAVIAAFEELAADSLAGAALFFKPSMILASLDFLVDDLGVDVLGVAADPSNSILGSSLISSISKLACKLSRISVIHSG